MVPLKRSTNAFCCGDPFSMKARATPCSSSHVPSEVAMNSRPLSERSTRGFPWRAKSRSSSSRTRPAPIERATRQPSARRVYSSTTFRIRSGEPSRVRPPMKSYDHTSFGPRAGRFQTACPAPPCARFPDAWLRRGGTRWPSSRQSRSTRLRLTRKPSPRSSAQSLLMIPLVGFLPPSDPRVARTVEAIRRELLHDGLVRRYSTDTAIDGLPGGEAAFLTCTLWLADNLTLLGRRRAARRRFERILELRNDVGLLSEEYDATAGRLVGNFPQALSHVGVVNTACNLTARQGPAEHRLRS